MSDLVERLEGIVRLPITDGLGPAGGDEPDNPNEFVRRFPVPPINLEAAAEIKRLQLEMRELREAIKRDAAEYQTTKYAHASVKRRSAQLEEEVGQLRAEVERLRDVIYQMDKALIPLAGRWLYPDDMGEAEAAMTRADPDWDEAKNEKAYDDVFIERGWVRAAREARAAALLWTSMQGAEVKA